ncbi:Hypothetical predicted protein [Mytilus galloprovincialis]|uniref:DDE Tnp4 domain-containing protein n=1 Tax=Mytilus galloprovincialis TaxID=29158 RepID=A0A8B6D677_MYTGA|nr:Hypothetical predicted protein [Mytilus galloprovincialis]
MAEVYLLLQDLITQTEDDSIDRLYQIHKSVSKRKLVFSVVSCLAAKRRHIARVKNYVENVIPQFTHDDYKNRFRMSRSTFDALVLSLSPQLAVGLKGGIMKVSIEKQLLIFIRYASCQQILTELADSFGIYIVGGQVLCMTREFLKTRLCLQVHLITKRECSQVNTHLIGDAAYALSQWVMTPFKDFGNLSAEQKRYNYIHSSSRMCIERAFGALKGRFRRLRYIDMKDMPEVLKFVLSCCTLHEVCLANFDAYIEEGLNANEEINDFQDFLRRRPSAQHKHQSIVDMLG